MKTNLLSISWLILAGLTLSFCNPNPFVSKSSDNNALLLGVLALNQGIPVSRASDLVNESSDNYAANNWGLIEHSTLQRWVSNWTNNKPTHIPSDGKLIILQISEANLGTGANDFIESKVNQGIHTYLLDDFRFNELRDTGLISFSVAYQATGAKADEWLGLYGINLSKDLVVFVNGSGNNFAVQDLTRGIYWLRYWGADIKNLALLNGNLSVNSSGWNLVSTSTSPGSVSNGNFSVKQLRVDNTILTLALEDVLAVVDGNYQTNQVEGISNRQFIIDARPTNQFDRSTVGAAFHATSPGQFITTAWNSSGPPSNDATGRDKNYVLFEGHIKGAKTFPWATLLDNSNGFKYKPKSELLQLVRNYLGDQTITKDSGITIISQCRTNFEVQVNGFATLNILGIPTVYYDGSLVEWTSLVANHPDDQFNLRPSDPAHRFRTDYAERSTTFNGSIPYNRLNNPTGSKIAQATINRNATTTRKMQLEDKAYKR